MVCASNPTYSDGFFVLSQGERLEESKGPCSGGSWSGMEGAPRPAGTAVPDADHGAGAASGRQGAGSPRAATPGGVPESFRLHSDLGLRAASPGMAAWGPASAAPLLRGSHGVSRRGSGRAAGELGWLLSGWGRGAGPGPFPALIHSLLTSLNRTGGAGRVPGLRWIGDSPINRHSIANLGKKRCLL